LRRDFANIGLVPILRTVYKGNIPTSTSPKPLHEDTSRHTYNLTHIYITSKEPSKGNHISWPSTDQLTWDDPRKAEIGYAQISHLLRGLHRNGEFSLNMGTNPHQCMRDEPNPTRGPPRKTITSGRDRQTRQRRPTRRAAVAQGQSRSTSPGPTADPQSRPGMPDGPRRHRWLPPRGCGPPRPRDGGGTDAAPTRRPSGVGRRISTLDPGAPTKPEQHPAMTGRFVSWGSDPGEVTGSRSLSCIGVDLFPCLVRIHHFDAICALAEIFMHIGFPLFWGRRV
jgi:hypothetical protein